MPQRRTRALWATTAAVLAVGLTTTSCSSQEKPKKREYAVPSSLCGTPVSPGALEPLLPGGDKLTSAKSGPLGFTLCHVMIDGKIAVTGIVEQRDSDTTLHDVAYGTYNLSAKSIRKELPDYVIAESSAVGHVPCRAMEKEGHAVFTMIRKEDGTVDTAALQKAITEYTEATSASKWCTRPSG
ncbi:hypothetical protein KUM39_04245 [Streptomyces sp. J2-1]|uniref:hypothetical protein n=1 Tax=Streptomyces corallincola TaxID=2851888 RepID=UPI001C383F5D|nr:hypothetical protein [Streptomyces corallincola]MBV2353575.1 hypothetical protein [Streptomyces corallincola]